MASSPQKSPSSPKSPTPKSPSSRKKDDSFLGKLGGTLARRKKAKEVSELQEEGINAINLPLSPSHYELDPEDTMLEENEVRTMVDPNSKNDRKLQELMKVLIDWINDVLVGERIIVKDLAEDLYDGQVLQKLFEKLEGEKLNVAEVTQSEIAQKQKLQTVLERINDSLKLSTRNIRWNVDSVHAKSIVAILHLLVALSQHFRAPIRLPDHVSIQVVVVQKREGILQSRQIQEEITGNTEAFSGRHERDAFDTLFDHAPDKLNVVKKTLITFVNKHLNKLNLEVSELDTQFADGVYLVLLMGLLEGYFVPLYNFFLTPENFDQKVHNVSFSFELMQDGGLEKPKPRPEDIVNCDLKSTLRVLYNLFTRVTPVPLTPPRSTQSTAFISFLLPFRAYFASLERRCAFYALSAPDPSTNQNREEDPAVGGGLPDAVTTPNPGKVWELIHKETYESSIISFDHARCRFSVERLNESTGDTVDPGDEGMLLAALPLVFTA
ncbi:alpha-parvin [Scomber scombrus]|uniref:Alpha-parvin n=1 Tax=Scomber scombrus TaxID=13677 RepID=A0AAV1PE82_SCOSC